MSQIKAVIMALYVLAIFIAVGTIESQIEYDTCIHAGMPNAYTDMDIVNLELECEQG